MIRQKQPHTTDYGCVYLRVCWLYAFMSTLLYLTGQQHPLPSPILPPSFDSFPHFLYLPSLFPPFNLSLPFFLESSESIELTNFLFHCPCSIPLRIAKTYTDMTETSHHKSICLETLSLLQVKKDGLFNHKTLFKNQSSNSF